MESFKSGITVGNGAAINVETGWIPDRVEVYNATDGDSLTVGYCNTLVIPFSGGGTNEIEAGNTITGATSAATAVVDEVLLYSGTWGAGTAAGFFVCSRDSVVGTFASENIVGEVVGATNDATVTVQVEHGFNIAAAVAGVTTTSAILAYVGSAGSAAKGFTIGSSVAEEAKLLRWSAWRDDR